MWNKGDYCPKTYILSGMKKNKGYAGGVFYELARIIIQNGGVVIGAAYTEDFNVSHMEADNMDMLKRLVGVKYAESHIHENLKKNIKTNLCIGRMVLFAGTPCQIEHIYQYLDREYENFYTVTIACSGVIQAKIWQDYVGEVQSNGSIITEIHYPYRGEFGISQTKVLIKFSHGTAYFRDEKEDKLLKLKRSGFIFKKECYQCAWDSMYMRSDIFLETYYKDTNEDVDQERGLTKTLILTKKGEYLFLSICSRMRLKQKLRENTNRAHKKLFKPKNYDYFWKYYDKYGFSFVSDLIVAKDDQIYKKIILQNFLEQYAILDANGISIETVLDNWGIKKFIIYGDGIVGKILIDKIGYTGKIYAVIDKKCSKDTREIEHIIDSNLPILIPPLNFIPDVMEELLEYGIERKRVVPLSMLINWEYDNKILNGPIHTTWDDKKGGMGDIYMITGAQFENKGAQSMLYVAVSELRRNYPDCDVYYLPIDSVENYPDSILEKYCFHIIHDRMDIYGQFYSLIPQLKAIVDVSGYALASKWNCSYFVRNLLLAKNNDIPIYLMPQSFGPFDFGIDWSNKIKGGLLHASMIFAREKEGYNLLTHRYDLKNVRMSKDLVLQNKGLIIENIYSKSINLGDYKLETDSNIAIIPNTRNYEFCDKDKLLHIYKHIIMKLLQKGKNIYILSHSNDEEACNGIYKLCADNKHVFMYKNKLDCLEYSILVKEFQYIIASRYHAIVHAYKEEVPCIAIGWAKKYEELLNMFEQEKYVFDVREKIDKREILGAIDNMDENWIREKEKLGKILPRLQKENCFDIIK